MAVDVTEIFQKSQDYFDEDTWNMIAARTSPLQFPGLKLVSTAQESKAINNVKTPAIIMATSGMCNAGRIKHHLDLRIERPENTILFVGYQGRGTLGRQILDGANDVRIYGRMHRVRAQVTQLHGLSGHADRAALLRWLGGLQSPPRRLFLTHGEADVSLQFADQLARQKQWSVCVPAYREIVNLA
jgi:metallo-beta-lactamase family protein